MTRPLTDAAIGHDLAGGPEPLLGLVDGTKLGRWLEGPVGVRSTSPWDALRTRDVSAAQHAFLRVLGHVSLPSGVLVGRADIDERLVLPCVPHDLVPKCANARVVACRRDIFTLLE